MNNNMHGMNKNQCNRMCEVKSNCNKKNSCNMFDLTDYGPEPVVFNIHEATLNNNAFRVALWTGKYFQMTLMSINVGEDIGVEMHSNLDQFVKIENGCGIVKMGPSKDKLNYQKAIYGDYAFIIPAGTWHNLINIGDVPLKLYSIYAPPQHPFGTVQETKEIAHENEHD